MKKTRLICLLILLFAVFLLCSCGSGTPAGTPSATAVPTPEPTPTPTPEPTAIPFDLAAENSEPAYRFLSDEQDLAKALSQIAANAEESEVDLIVAEDSGFEGAVRIDDCGQKGDYMAVSGEWLYLLADRDMLILHLNGTSTQIVSRTPVGISWSGRGEEPSEPVSGYEKTPSGIYCAGNRVVVTCDWYGYENAPGDVNYTEYTCVDIYDVKNPAAPVWVEGFGQDGSILSAGVYEDLFFLVTDCPFYEDSAGRSTELPMLYTSYGKEALPCGSVCFAEDGACSGCLLTGLYDMKSARRVDAKAMMGTRPDVYAAEGDLVFFNNRLAEHFSRMTAKGEEKARIRCSDVFRWTLDSSGIALAAAKTVNGEIMDSACLDLYDDCLRCFTKLNQRLYTSGNPAEWEYRETGSAVYLLDNELSVRGKISAAVDQPQICWVGFLQDRAALTTDDGKSMLCSLTDPPADLADLPKENGLAADAVRTYGDMGFTAFYQSDPGKLELTIYDEKLKAMDTCIFGSDHSSTLENTRGYTTDGNADIIGFSADDSYCLYGFDKKEGLYFRTDVFLNDWAWNARGISGDKYFYIADSREIVALDKADLSEVIRIAF